MKRSACARWRPRSTNPRECIPATVVGKRKRKLKCCSHAKYVRRLPRKGAYPGGPQTAPAGTLGGGTGGGSPPPDRKPGIDSALTRKPVTCWQLRSLPAAVVVSKPLPNVGRNHRRYGQCPACDRPELPHLQPRKHIRVNILAARHVRQKQIHVPLGKEKEKPARKRHEVGALTRARRPNLHHRHVVRVQENLCVMPFLATAMDGDRHGKQLQDIDMISAEGRRPRRVKQFQTEHRAKPHSARVGSKPVCRCGGGKKARPFQLGRKSTHHAMSARATAVRLMWWAKAGTVIHNREAAGGKCGPDGPPCTRRKAP